MGHFGDYVYEYRRHLLRWAIRNRGTGRDGLYLPIVSVLLSLAFGVGIGSSSVIARALGANQTDLVKSYTSHSILIALCVAISFAVLGHHYMDEIFTLLGAPPELFPKIHEFMDIWFLGSFIVVVPMVGNAAIRAAGNTRIPSAVMIVVAIINIILDPILIFGLFGFPRLELAGAAIATLIAYSAALIMGLYFLIHKLKFLSFNACTKHVKKSWAAILRLSLIHI